MEKNNNVTCPKCQHQFSIETALTADIQKNIQEKLKKEFNEKFILEIKKKDDEYLERDEKAKLERKRFFEDQDKENFEKRKELEVQLKRKLEQENTEKLESLKKQNDEQEAKLKDFRKLQIEKMEMESKMKQMADENEFNTKKLLLEKENELKERIGKEAEQKNDLKIKDFQKQIDEQVKLIEEMKRKVEQGSMQRDGEVQELAIEEMLKQTFLYDDISEVGKGVRGADIIQIVKNNQMVECGKIVWESKRTKEFQPVWIDKFKADFRQSGGDIGVIVTQTMPKDMSSFGLRDGIYICQYNDAKSLAYVLRQSLISICDVQAAQENKGEKMTMLYNFLTSNEFKHYIEAINEGFLSMSNSIQQERNSMEKLWKEREKQIAKVLLNTSGLYGSIRGIAGSVVADVKGLELGSENLLE
ncbi:MAG: DUF2130 domain-containing protein [Bacteroidetes bacterium]|nr:DUF2130 domain-containing protein [Bacteroidota bacterium]